MKSLFSQAILALALFLIHPSAQATQFIPLTIEELGARSQLILRGAVETKTCQRDGSGRIYTRLQVRVAEVWKGSLSTNLFTVVQSGGVLGEERAVVSGQPEFHVGEEFVGFLVLNQRNEGVILGVAQGKFEVWRDTTSGEKFARNIFHGGPPPATPGKSIAPGSVQVPSNWRLKVSDLKQRTQAARQ